MNYKRSTYYSSRPIINRMYQINANYKRIKSYNNIKSYRKEKVKQRKLAYRITKPTGINFNITINTQNNQELHILNSDSIFQFDDVLQNKQSRNLLQKEFGLPLDNNDFTNFSTTYNNYLATLFPLDNMFDEAQQLKIPSSIINPYFYPQNIQINPTINAINWGWIIRVNPSILRFDYSLSSFFNLLLNYFNVFNYFKSLNIISKETGMPLTNQEMNQLFINNRTFRISLAYSYRSFLLNENLPIIIDQSSLSIDSLFDFGSIKSRFEEIKNIYQTKNIDSLQAIFNLSDTVFSSFKNFFSQSQKTNLIDSEFDRCWRSIFRYNENAVYFLIMLLDCNAYCAKVNNYTIDMVSRNDLISTYIQHNKYVTGLSIDHSFDQYFLSFSTLLSNKLIKIYPCNQMIGKNWQIKNRKGNSLVFFVCNKDVQQTVNFTFYVNMSMSQFKQFLMNSQNSQRYDMLSEDFKNYIKRMLPGLEEYFKVKDHNFKFITESIDKNLNINNKY